MDAFSLTDIKRKNLSDVYHYIYQNQGCSKQSIANALSISLPTVSQHLTTLIESKLIEKSGQLSSSVGRKATAYQIIPNARISIGVEILSKTVYVTALNLYGKKEATEKFSLAFQPKQLYFEELQKDIKNFLQKYGYTEEQLLGIGLGIQGLVSPDGTKLTYGKILDCTGLSIKMFSDYFSVPSKFIHDAECASISELWENPEVNTAIYLSLGQHLGGSIIIDGEIQNGLTGKSGVLEHMTFIPNGKECYCGKRGCAECYCSGTFLTDGEMELEEFFSRKESGDLNCQKKWEEYLQYLSMFINNLHMVLDSNIILGGNITPYFTEEDIHIIKQNVLEYSTFQDDISYIIQGKCRNDSVSIGAALPFIKDFLNGIAFII